MDNLLERGLSKDVFKTTRHHKGFLYSLLIYPFAIAAFICIILFCDFSHPLDIQLKNALIIVICAFSLIGLLGSLWRVKFYTIVLDKKENTGLIKSTSYLLCGRGSRNFKLNQLELVRLHERPPYSYQSKRWMKLVFSLSGETEIGIPIMKDKAKKLLADILIYLHGECDPNDLVIINDSQLVLLYNIY